MGKIKEKNIYKLISGILSLVVLMCVCFIWIEFSKKDNMNDKQTEVKTEIKEQAKLETSGLEVRVQGFEQKMLELENDNMKLVKEITKINDEIKETKRMLPTKKNGEYFVKASQLNVRKGPSVDFDTIGTVGYGSKVEVIDTVDPKWYKVRVSLGDYDVDIKEKVSVYSVGKNTYTINNRHIDGGKLVGGEEYYMRSSYLNEKEIEAVHGVPLQGKNPFVYGLLFFDPTIEKLLEGEIWSQMEDELRMVGYDTVDVVPVNRETYEEDFKNGKFDAVESASGQFARINNTDSKMDVFAKNIINGKSVYEGIVLVNKESGITNFEHLKGKTVLTGKTYSESSYQYQKNYLYNVEGIDIEKDMNIEPDNYHQVVFYEVAKGNANAGFCGDFVLEDSYAKMKDSLGKSKINLESEEELRQLRNQVLVLPMRGADPIPNNPHAITKQLSNNKEFVDKLFGCVQTIYENNKEDYGLTRATTREYDVLVSMQ